MDDKEGQKGLHVVDGIEHVENRGDADWNPDNFPTSAKPIFRAAALLTLLVIALCFATYSCSDNEEPKSERTTAPQGENPLDDGEF